MNAPAAPYNDDSSLSPDLLRQLAYNEKMAELGKISAGIVHELNAPLSVIISAAQMIMREPGVSEAIQEMINRISSEAQRLSHLTKGLLNFSSHHDSTIETDINLTIEFVLNFLNYEAARRGVTVLRNFDHSLPMTYLDANMLKQILLNVVMNALQAMEELGGKLLIETSLSGEHLAIAITDNGPGIAPDIVDRIFDRYYTTKKPGEGTGLGLFVTKSLVENMGGNITVSSRCGGGTTFSIYLPRKSELPTQDTPSR